jgi:hypothetical protein
MGLQKLPFLQRKKFAHRYVRQSEIWRLQQMEEEQ